MNKKQIGQEFQKIDNELRCGKYSIASFSPDVIKRRELLLFAQVCLSDMFVAKKKKDKASENFQESLYETIMSNYYNWDKDEQETAQA